MKKFLGFDTSNYTTSMAIVDENGEVLLNKQIKLSVKDKERGLRQSDALFLHIKNLPLLIENEDITNVASVAASVTPRSVEGSYMPVFLASRNYGMLVAKSQDVPFYETSHQTGHILAALVGNTLRNEKEFFAVQLSGGTFEVLHVKRSGVNFCIDILYSSADITAGQLLDRIGVAMDEQFPCGKAMDDMAMCANSTYKFKPSLTKEGVSFAGLETKIRMNYLNNPKFDKNTLSRSIFEVIAFSVRELIHRAKKQYSVPDDVLFCGGVCEGICLRSFLENSLREEDLKIHFAQKSLSNDNAVGVSQYGRLCYIEDNK